MFNKILGKFSRDVGIDLGTAFTRVYVRGRGIVVSEPTVVAINKKTDQILATGEEAKLMMGKTPPYIEVVKPLVHGIISDFEATEKLLRFLIEKIHEEKFSLIAHPRIIIGTPLELTEVEQKAVGDAAKQAGAREVYLVENVMAAAIGERLPVHEAKGTMIASIGGGATEIAVISLSGIVTAKTLKIAGETFDQEIIKYVKEKFNLYIGERTAEEVKIKVGSLIQLKTTLELKISGRDVMNGLPREIVLTNREVKEAINRPWQIILEQIQEVLENTPPELISDIHKQGVVLVGGSAMLKGVSDVFSQELKIPCRLSSDPLTAVVRGTGILLEDAALRQEVCLPPA